MDTLLEETSTVTEPWALRDLPPFPWITTKLLQLFAASGDEVEVTRMTELIRSDASLASELLRRANSALFGLRSQVSSVDRAASGQLATAGSGTVLAQHSSGLGQVVDLDHCQGGPLGTLSRVE